MEVIVISESNGDLLHPVTAQLVGASSSLGGNITILCPGGKGLSEAAEISGVSKVISVEGDCFQSYDSNAWSKALAPHAEGDLVLTSSSSTGRELASSIAAIRGIPVLQDATNISEGIVVSRPIYSGKVIETSSVKIPCVITLRANSYEASESSGKAEISTVNQTADVTISIRKALERAGEKIDVSEADIIISGGRGMGEPSNFSNLEEVADLLGAAVGASRAAVDTWDEIPHSMQVGQTGKTVTPSLYIAVGISGAIQHLAGMRTSKYIVAINKDPEAPIFGVADYGVVATWEEALPALKNELSALLSN